MVVNLPLLSTIILYVLVFENIAGKQRYSIKQARGPSGGTGVTHLDA